MPVGINETDQATFNLIWSKLNQDLSNIVQKFKSATAPTSTAPLMWWFDSTNSILKLRNEADDAWIDLFYIDGSDNLYAAGPLRINQNNDTMTISHDGTDVSFTWSDGELILQTDEGTNSDTTVAVKEGYRQGQDRRLRPVRHAQGLFGRARLPGGRRVIRPARRRRQ